jgi:hypothetical protein
MEFEGFPQVRQRFLFGFALAGHIDLQALGDIPGPFPPDRCGEWAFHGTILSYYSWTELEMTRSEILTLVQNGAANAPLPRNVAPDSWLIVSAKPSKCCRAPSMIVRSRSGNFITQDCLQCGQKTDYPGLDEIPDLDCVGCQSTREMTAEPTIIDKNYWYRCTCCGRKWEIGLIVPIWSDIFEYVGLAAPGDAGFQR